MRVEKERIEKGAGRERVSKEGVRVEKGCEKRKSE